MVERANGKPRFPSFPFLAAAAAGMGFTFVLVFAWVPTEATQGLIQRVFYFHVPCAWVSFLGYGITAFAGILYLRKREDRWDDLAGASAEIGVLFGALVLITGPIWAHREWGTWWEWNLKLTLALVLFLTYATYLLLRRLLADGGRRAVLSAMLAVAGFVNVPFVFIASRFLDRYSLHPGGVIGGRSGGLEPSMLWTLLVSLASHTLLFGVLLRLRLRVVKAECAVRRIREDAEERQIENGCI